MGDRARPAPVDHVFVGNAITAHEIPEAAEWPALRARCRPTITRRLISRFRQKLPLNA